MYLPCLSCVQIITLEEYIQIALAADRIVAHAGEGNLHLGEAKAYRRVMNEAPRLQTAGG